MKKAAFGIAIAAILAAVYVFAPGSDFWTTTAYCPWSHRIGYKPWVCKVRDRDPNRVLVKHANLDSNKLQLSITQRGGRTWIEHPDGHVKEFSNDLKANTIIFDRQDMNFLLVNGERFAITLASEN